MKCYGLKEIIRAKDNKLYNVERDKKKKNLDGWIILAEWDAKSQNQDWIVNYKTMQSYFLECRKNTKSKDPKAS